MQETTRWVLAIDGMKDQSVITTTQKVSVPSSSSSLLLLPASRTECAPPPQLALLQTRYFWGIRGGSIKSTEDEEWIYNGRTGELHLPGTGLSSDLTLIHHCAQGR